MGSSLEKRLVLVQQNEFGLGGAAGRAEVRRLGTARHQLAAAKAFPKDFGLVLVGVVTVVGG